MQAGCNAGTGDHQRHAGRAFEEVHLEPEATLAEHVAVIRAEQDQRVIEHPGAGQRIDELADLFVKVGNIGEIGLARPANVLFGHRKVLVVAGMDQPLRMRILFSQWYVAHLRQQLVAIAVEIPEFAARHIGVVRMGERDGDSPGRRASSPCSRLR